MAVPSSRYFFGFLPAYSTLIVSGAIIAIILATLEANRRGFKKDTILDLSLWLLPAGIIGARIYYVIFTWSEYRENPLRVLYIWEGGLAIYGALIAGILVIFIFSRKRGLSFAELMDVLVPGVVLAQAIGRWGNYFNREAYGLPITNPSWQFFPAGVLIPDVTGTWHMATFFYESVWDLLVFIFLMSFRHKRFNHNGDTLCWYAFLYAAGRLVIEDLRTDSLMSAKGSVRVSQLLSVLLCIVILIHFVFNRRKNATPILKVLYVLSVLFTVIVLIPVIPHLFNANSCDGQYTLMLLRFSLVAVFAAILVFFTRGKDVQPNADNAA